MDLNIFMDPTEFMVINNETDSSNPEGDGEEKRDPVTVMSILLVGTFLSLLIFLSVAGNILVCVAIYTDRGLRRIGNLFLASLAIADLFVASLVMTFAGVNDLLGYWVFGAQFCDTWVAFDVMCSTASILNLCAISLDRYIHIKDPLRQVRTLGYKASGCYNNSHNLAPCSTYFFRSDLSGTTPTTSTARLLRWWKELPYVRSGPYAQLRRIYCRLYCYAQKHVKSIRAVTRPLDIPDPTKDTKKSIKQRNKALHIQMHNHHSSPYHVSDHKAAITVGIIMGVFLICWVPFFCINIVAAFCKTCIPDITFKILTWLGYSNSAFNPIIYSIFNTEFREAFKRILTAHYPEWCKCGYQSVSLNQTDKFITDYGTKTVIVTAKRNGSFKEYSSDHLSPRSSPDSVRQTRINSTDREILEGEEISAI
ncbi:Dopamine 1-like receptor 1 [Carabus blaptoides fortunei]